MQLQSQAWPHSHCAVRRSNRIGPGEIFLFGERCCVLRADGEAGAGGPEQERAFRLPLHAACLLAAGDAADVDVAFRFPAGLVD
jgi:hypothetical protein